MPVKFAVVMVTYRGGESAVLGRNHFLVGISAGLLVAGTFHGHPEYLVSGALSGLSALVPDLDSPKSRLGREIAPASWAAGKILGHRGVTHSLVGAAAAGFLFSALLHSANPAWLSWLPWGSRSFGHILSLFLAGYLSHLATDCLTREGCPLLWPLSKRWKIPLMATGNPLGEGIVTVAAIVFIFSLLSGHAGMV